MFGPITIPFGAKMLYNVVKLKPDVTMEQVELALGEMCNVVKNKYGHGGGFIAGQVFEFAGFISEEGSTINHPEDKHIVIATYWESFEQHEASHKDNAFHVLFEGVKQLCDETYEIGYNLLWQGIPE